MSKKQIWYTETVMFSDDQKTKKTIPIPTVVWAVGSAVIFLTLGFIAGGYVLGGTPSNSLAASMLSLLNTNDTPDVEIPLTPRMQEVPNVAKTQVAESDQTKNPVLKNRTGDITQQTAQARTPSAPIEQKKETSKNTTASKKAQSICAFQDIVASSSLTHGVRINEIAWMGTVPTAETSAARSAQDEWIELHNTSDQPINISGWQIRSRTDGLHIIIPDETYVSAGGFVLLERSDDESVPTIPADVVYEGGLSNAGADIQLSTAGCDIVDYVDGGNGWQAGNSQTKQTMERKSDGWQTSYQPGGTPKLPNSAGAPLSGNLLDTTNASTTTSTTVATAPVSTGGGGGGGGGASVTPQTSYPPLVISEVQTASASSTKHEFIELYNPNPSPVSLDSWYLQKKSKSADTFSTLVPKELLLNKIIGARAHLVIANPSSSIVAEVAFDYGIANDNTIVLKNPNGDIVDLLGMGVANHCEGDCAVNPPEDASIRRIINEDGQYKDTDNNNSNFIVDACPSPGSSICVATYQPSVSATTSTTSSSQSEHASSTDAQNTSSTDMMSSSSTATSTIPQGPPTETASSTATSTVHTAMVRIHEVQIIGSSGLTTQDYIKLYNADTESVDLSGWKLRKRTASGTESSLRVFPDASMVAPGGLFVWAHTGDGFDQIIGAHTGSTATIAGDTSIALITKDGTVVDSVAWGSEHTAPFVETALFPDNPIAGQVLRRKMANGIPQDTDNNAIDFELVLATTTEETPVEADVSSTSTPPA
ncbi:MAG: hypothetical protein RIQ54_294 [Candidatus Parcubacteria bacterium]|jgi:hypothetical protein